MKILYGVVGEGMGHAIRSSVVLDYLVSQGHEMEIMVSSRAAEFLSKRFSGVNRIHGFHMIYDENRVRRGKTLWSNVLAGIAGVPTNIARYFELIAEFKPDLVISDFESWTYYFAKIHRLPIISIDNPQIIDRCKHPHEVVEGLETDFQVTKAFVKGKLPFCNHYFVTTFFYPEIRKPDTTLVPPILRKDILDAKRISGKHLLVYQTAEGNELLEQTLSRTGIECRMYGIRRNIKEEQVEGNLRYMPFSEKQFVEDLATSRAVIAGGGFTLMGEAVYLRKPMLSVPVQHQFEQIINARYLEHLKYGQSASSLDHPETITKFLDQLPLFEATLAKYEQDGNKKLFGLLDEMLDKVEAGIV